MPTEKGYQGWHGFGTAEHPLAADWLYNGFFAMTSLLVIRTFRLVLPSLLLSGCGAGAGDATLFSALEEIPSPAAPGSAQPNLAAAGARVYLSWLEPQGGGVHALRVALREGAGWTPPITIAEGDNFFVNWADFPSVAALPDGTLAAHWLVRSGPRSYDYDVHIALSPDEGRTWSQSVIPHRDGTESEHGFVSLFPWPAGGLGAVWLDGRNFAAAPHGEDGHAPGAEMTLRHTTLSGAGEPGPEVLLDSRTCECCQTAAALTANGPVVVYRNRSPEEIRDISIVRYVEDGWTEPSPVHHDGWQISGCPVNGPAVAAAGANVAVAWFTSADDVPRVKLAFSRDAGASFAAPVQVDDGRPTGRVGVVLLGDGSALVSWLELVGEEAELRVRRVLPDGTFARAATVAETSPARASGFPRMLQAADEVVFAWTQPGNPGRIRVAVARLGQL